MRCARTLSWIALAALLTGCAVPSTNFSKAPDAQAALARCRAQSNERPASDPNPFGAVADQNQFVVDCMKRAGYNVQ